MNKNKFLIILCICAFAFGALLNFCTESFETSGITTVLHTNFSVPQNFIIPPNKADYQNKTLILLPSGVCKQNPSDKSLLHSFLNTGTTPQNQRMIFISPTSKGKSQWYMGDSFQIQAKNLFRHNKKDGWRKNYIRKKLQFSFHRQKKTPAICAGDVFFYLIPKGYSIKTDFKNGEIRCGNHPLLRYSRAEEDNTKILKFTFTEYGALYSYFGNVTGEIVLELESDFSHHSP